MIKRQFPLIRNLDFKIYVIQPATKRQTTLYRMREANINIIDTFEFCESVANYY